MQVFRKDVAAAVILVALSACASLAQSTLVEEHFSFSPPAAWTVRKTAMSRFAVAFAKPADGFAANINVVEQAYPGTMKQYADLNVKALSQLPDFKLAARSTFAASGGLQGVRLKATYTMQSRPLRAVFYLFPGKSHAMYVVTCSALASDGAKFDAAFDKSMRTFRVR